MRGYKQDIPKENLVGWENHPLVATRKGTS